MACIDLTLDVEVSINPRQTNKHVTLFRLTTKMGSDTVVMQGLLSTVRGPGPEK